MNRGPVWSLCAEGFFFRRGQTFLGEILIQKRRTVDDDLMATGTGQEDDLRIPQGREKLCVALSKPSKTQCTGHKWLRLKDPYIYKSQLKMNVMKKHPKWQIREICQLNWLDLCVRSFWYIFFMVSMRLAGIRTWWQKTSRRQAFPRNVKHSFQFW